MRKTLSLGAAALGISLVSAASADQIRVLDQHNGIWRFDTDTGATTEYKPITGLLPDEHLRAIDVSNGVLYGLTEERLYRIDGITAEASPVGPRFAEQLTLLSNQSRPFDFRPYSSEALLLGHTKPPGVGPVTGTHLILFDAKKSSFEGADWPSGSPRQYAYVADDAAFGAMPVLTALTQRPDGLGLGQSEAFAVDSARGALVRVGAKDTDPRTPEALELRTVGALTGFVEPGEHAMSMDATLTGTLVGKTILMTQSPTVGWTYRFYRVDVATGALTNVGQMSPALLLDISEAPAVSLGPPEVLDVTRAQVVVDFKKKDRDTATIVGLIDVPQGGWAGKKLQVDFGGIVREFVLDGRGRGTSGADTFRIAPRPKKGGWQFTLKLGKGRFAKQLGLDADQPIGSVDVVLDLFVTDPAEELFFGPAAHRSQFRMDYFVRRNGRATATRRQN